MWYDELFCGYHNDVWEIIIWLPKLLNGIISGYNCLVGAQDKFQEETQLFEIETRLVKDLFSSKGREKLVGLKKICIFVK